MEKFVQEAKSSDADFAMLTERLREYRWGNKPDRHVMVMDRYGQLQFSSLEGTLPIDRYQDVEGRKFLKDITLLADRLEASETQMVPLDLMIQGEKVPYVLLYTYVPKHDSFIIVRMPRKDLA